MIELFLQLLRANRIDYYWDTVYDPSYDRDIDYVVVGNIAVLATHLQRFNDIELVELVEGMLNAQTKNELQEY